MVGGATGLNHRTLACAYPGVVDRCPRAYVAEYRKDLDELWRMYNIVPHITSTQTCVVLLPSREALKAAIMLYTGEPEQMKAYLRMHLVPNIDFEHLQKEAGGGRSRMSAGDESLFFFKSGQALYVNTREEEFGAIRLHSAKVGVPREVLLLDADRDLYPESTTLLVTGEGEEEAEEGEEEVGTETMELGNPFSLKGLKKKLGMKQAHGVIALEVARQYTMALIPKVGWQELNPFDVESVAFYRATGLDSKKSFHLSETKSPSLATFRHVELKQSVQRNDPNKHRVVLSLIGGPTLAQLFGEPTGDEMYRATDMHRQGFLLTFSTLPATMKEKAFYFGLNGQQYNKEQGEIKTEVSSITLQAQSKTGVQLEMTFLKEASSEAKASYALDEMRISYRTDVIKKKRGFFRSDLASFLLSECELVAQDTLSMRQARVEAEASAILEQNKFGEFTSLNGAIRAVETLSRDVRDIATRHALTLSLKPYNKVSQAGQTPSSAQLHDVLYELNKTYLPLSKDERKTRLSEMCTGLEEQLQLASMDAETRTKTLTHLSFVLDTLGHTLYSIATKNGDFESEGAQDLHRTGYKLFKQMCYDK